MHIDPFESFKSACDQLFVQTCDLTWDDLCGDDGRLEDAIAVDQDPAAFVDDYVSHYGLDSIQTLNPMAVAA